MTDEHVAIKPTRGRPLLTWVGKTPLKSVIALPTQHVESYGAESDYSDAWLSWPQHTPRSGLIYHGDNKDVLAHLIANGFRGRVNLIYIDPPFDSGADYVRKVELRGKTRRALDGEGYTLGEQVQYTDIWANDNYLQFMYERLMLLRELLAETGSIFVHLDYRRVHTIRCIMDEVFGADRFRNEIIWTYKGKGLTGERGAFPSFHATILSYGSSGTAYFEPQREAEIAESVLNRFGKYLREDGTITFGALRDGNERAELDKATRRFVRENSREPRDEDVAVRYEAGSLIRDVWTDVPVVRGNTRYAEFQGYPTQKPERLLERIVASSCPPGGLVLDCFSGSGTTAAVAQQLGRRWIAADINKGAVQTTAKRLLPTLEQADAAVRGLNIFRINDYDLQIQHNEAVNLIVEHVGIDRTLTDTFFDGTLGNQLVKIVPLEHPLSPVDLDQVSAELAARPDEARDVTVIALGSEEGARAWLEDWNALRRVKGGVNKIHVLELRTDPHLGRFVVHEAPTAEVIVKRYGNDLTVEVVDFLSPSVINRLGLETSVVRPLITDWRSMVDSIAIDTSYGGGPLSIAHFDCPSDKSEFVTGRYRLAAPSTPTTVAVKVTDMLGGEVVVTRDV